MSGQNTQQLKRWFEEVWNQGREQSIDELLDPKVVLHGLGGQDLQGPGAFKVFHRQMMEIFSDMHVTVEHALEAGEWIAHHAVAHMKHNASGKHCELRGNSVARMVDGKVVETWDCWDFLGLLIQVGALPDTVFEEGLQGRKLV